MTTAAGEYGGSAFNASDVIQDLVRLGPPAIVTNITLGVQAFGQKGTLTDVPEPVPPETTLDRDQDLLMVFDGQRAGLHVGDQEACVVGLYRTSDGQKQQFYGCDSIDVR